MGPRGEKVRGAEPENVCSTSSRARAQLADMRSRMKRLVAALQVLFVGGMGPLVSIDGPAPEVIML